MGRKIIDIKGKRFGRYLVLKYEGIDKWGVALWKCLCDCGTIKIVSGNHLRAGITKSCGCYRREITSEISRINLIDQRFGRYLVLEFAYTKDSYAHWKCQCDCGTIKIVSGANLRNGHTQSCGCLQKEKSFAANIIDITGKRFYRYLVLKFDSIRNHSAYWKCLCDCGAIKVVSGKNLRSGTTKSCGCYNREKTSEANYNLNLTEKERQDRREYPEYIEWRKAVYERDDYTCQCCGKRGGKLAAHHLESYANNPELRTLLENGITLCEECHGNFHHIFGYGNTRKQFEEFLQEQENLISLRIGITKTNK